jgi:magnesium transporter
MHVFKENHLSWINIEKPTRSQIAKIGRDYDIHSLILTELQRHTLRTKVDNYGHFLYLVLHFPVYDHNDTGPGTEIDFIIGKDFLITVQYTKNELLTKFVKKCLKGHIPGFPDAKRSSGHLFHAILSHLLDSVTLELDTIDKNISSLENKIFRQGRNDEVIQQISLVRQEILDFRRAVRPQRSVLESLGEQGKDFFGRELEPYFNALQGHHQKIWNYLENHKESIEALQQTNESMISIRTNEITKTLTIMAFITFPLTLLASLFGMNTIKTPIVGNPNDFWIIIAIMFVCMLSMIIFFRYKKWI